MQYHRFYNVVIAGSLMVLNAVADGRITQLTIEEYPLILGSGTVQGSAADSPSSERAVVLTIETTSGNEYQLQGTASLTSGSWDNIGAVFAATQSETSVLFPESSSYAFFRVIVVLPGTDPLPPPTDPPPTPVV